MPRPTLALQPDHERAQENDVLIERDEGRNLVASVPAVVHQNLCVSERLSDSNSWPVEPA